MKPAKRRVDLLLVERGLCGSRQEAQRLLLAGKVQADGRRVEKAGSLLPAEIPLAVEAPPHPFVSRGGVKLRHALETFRVDPAGRLCLDVGASTGGFTDCLLQHGARLVVAVDVGYGQFAARLRDHPRVLLLERTNIRHLAPDALPARAELAVIDVSFISLEVVLPAVLPLLAEPAEVVALVKPQFEAGRGRVGKRGVVRDPAVHREVLERVAAVADGLGLSLRGLTASPLLGPMGNREFLVHLGRDAGVADPAAAIAGALQNAPGT
ncbi:MAG: TlyA family RNA methyltransferase [Candidatus Methylomirabilota bacterium]